MTLEGQCTPDDLAALLDGRSLTLHIVRHAETEYNVGHRMQGWSDSPITALGHEQIATLGRMLAPVAFDAVFSSDLQRCRTTLAGILTAGGEHPEPEYREDLREWNFGGNEERKSHEVWGQLLSDHNLEVDRELSALRVLAERLGWSGLFDAIAELDETGRSEKAAAIVVRADRALSGIFTQLRAHTATNLTALIVCHGGFITTLLRQLVPEVAPDYILPNCSVSTVRLRDGVWSLAGLGVQAADFVAN